MHVHTTLAAAAGTSDTANYPYILGLLAIAISLVAIFRVSALARQQNQSAGASAPQAPAATAKATTPSAPAAPHDGIAPEIIAAIAAAVATVTGKSHRIISIKPMSTSWEKAGRHSVLTSHRIR
jgi:hypothetical protein